MITRHFITQEHKRLRMLRLNKAGSSTKRLADTTAVLEPPHIHKEVNKHGSAPRMALMADQMQVETQ